MRTTLLPFLLILFLFSASNIFAQFNVFEKVKKKVNKTIEKNVDEQINKTVDGAEKDIKEGPKENDTNESIDEKATSENDVEITEENKVKLKVWSKYNFVPGDNIIFEDNLSDEENGEFPSRWDLLAGSAENASLGEDNIINFVQNNTVITPLMETVEYLPEIFTLEFDVYFHDLATSRSDNYTVQFWTNTKNRPRDKNNKLVSPMLIKWNMASLGSFSGKSETSKEAKKNWEGKWKHIAISFNKRSLKVFLDEARVLNIPNLGFKPKVFAIGSQYDERYIDISGIKNIRVAEGGKKLYDRVMADGKFVTTGILFDVNKATIKPESMGIINQIVKMMQEHQDLNFSIEGHTDSDGNDSYNQTLSEDRASSVKATLISLGISEGRLTTKGFGESVPVDNNSTPEGKANNRRVEFIKM